MHQPLTHTLGFPRIGANRELKHVIEAFWRGEADEAALHRVARAIRKAGWRLQREAGIDLPASNDFSFYDQVLDTLCLVGALPRRFDAQEATVSLGTMFALARGSQQQRGGLRPLSMTKWFDTNYHHLVPELAPDMRFRLASDKPFDEFREALGLGILTKPVLVGPVTLLGLGRPAEGVAPFDRWSLLPALTEIYVEVLRRLTALGADWIQLDEPLLALDLDEGARAAFTSSYAALTRGAPGSRVMVASYYGPLRENLATYLALPVAGLHYDVVRGADDDEWSRLLTAFPRGKVLSAGVVDGRNVWRTDLARAWANLERARAAVTSAGLMVAPSCSLLHVPHSLQDEGQLAAPLRRRLAFATEKLAEVATLARALRGEDVAQAIADSQQASAAPVGLQGLGALAAVGDPSGAIRRRQPFAQRRILQQMRAPLPLLPTTTIGSFPQTAAVRQARARWRKGQLTTASYEALLEAETAAAIARQEAVGLDLLVHGEFERTDMVEYFAEQLEGFAVTDHGWVQSYGTRCWKPPIVHGPVSRPGPMTVRWARFAQGLTSRPVKGMLTGPVTLLKWSFVRDDQPLAHTCAELALAVRDEVVDLARAGLAFIQIDEPSLREALPLRRAEQPAYLAWAVACFRLAAGGVGDDVQIHTHMCYADFAAISGAVQAMDADVLTIENARSNLDPVADFARNGYANNLGPGVWDIHSPRVPSAAEMGELLERAVAALPAQRLWVNPDCGLKTRSWDEVEPALRNLVAAAQAQRARLSATQGFSQRSSA